jgi:membrane-bound lytic murein transglycosylase MltF
MWFAALLCFGATSSTLGQRPPDASSPEVPPSVAKVRRLSLAEKPWTGDFDKMVDRRMIRVLVPYGRTLYFNDKGRERGLTAELVRDFEQYINRKLKTGKRPITVYLIPTTRDKLLPKLIDGLGDIAAGNLTVTVERLRDVDFVVQTDRKPVKELVVIGAKGPAIASVDELAGQTVHVRQASSYYDSLRDLNMRLRAAGKPEANLQLVPDALEDEDMMEMANAGLIDVLIVDDWKAMLWRPILPNLKIDEKVFVREGGRVGWAIHNDRPKLVQIIRQFDSEVARKQGIYEYRLKRTMRQMKQLKDSTQSSDWKRFERTITLFHRYGGRYGFDPLMLAAQGYQESQLDQNAKSQVGAVGVMQIMPATGAEMRVGDIHVTENNIHAGAKYMDILMTKYFPDASFSEGNRPLFAFAAYNAGPGNIARMRTEAAKRGLDPDKWFNNVEVVVAEKIGMETTTYVRNIYKYYVTYKLTLDAQETRRKALDELKKVRK